MSDTAIERRAPWSLKEKGQYALGFGVVAVMLFLVGFPVILLGFFGGIGFLVWKLMTAESRGETRRIFEFYLTANEILRQDERRWFGFEVKETIARGEAILRSMPAAPPLVHFALGALYSKVGDYSLADKHLSMVADEEASNELAIVFPSKELRDYTRVLRKIERNPAEAPLTSAAVRALERARKNRIQELLQQCRDRLAETARTTPALNPPDYAAMAEEGSQTNLTATDEKPHNFDDATEMPSVTASNGSPARRRKPRDPRDPRHGRKTISEVLHDIYDSHA
nr:hypothetical protein [uncultured bacterium]